MFERDKKEKDWEGGMDTRAAAPPPRSTAAPAPPRTPTPGGEAAVIGRSIQINGDVRGDEDLRIEGDISGTVQLKNANLTIGKEGRVKADVYAKAITVHGTSEGDLYATERVNVHLNANVRGNITSPKVGIEEGCKFKGSIEMDQAEVDKALGKMNMQGSAASPAVSPGKPGEGRPTPTAVKGAASN